MGNLFKLLVGRRNSYQRWAWLLAGGLFLLRLAVVPLVRTPWIWADELVYADTAHRIAHQGKFSARVRAVQHYPPGYPLVLAPATLLKSTRLSYPAMLVTNCLLASLTGLLAFYLARRYLPEPDALIASLLVGLAPSVSVYPYVIMSENLFTPLLLAVCLLLVRAVESGSPLAWLWVGVGTGGLMLTRAVGVMAVPATVVAALVEWRRRRHWLFGLTALGALAVGIILLEGPWLHIKSQQAIGPSSITGYQEGAYLANLRTFLTDWLVFKTVLRLALHQWLGVALAAGGVFFLFAMDLLVRPAWGLPRSFRSLVLFFLLLALGFTLASTMHMWRSYLWAGDKRYALIMRYMDPLVPVVLVLGVVGLVRLREGWAGRWARARLTLLASIGLLLFLNPWHVLPFGYPMENYKFPSVLSVWYVEPLGEFLNPSGGKGKESADQAASPPHRAPSLGDRLHLPPHIDLRRILIALVAVGFAGPFLLSKEFLRRRYAHAGAALFLVLNFPLLFQQIRVGRAAEGMNVIPKWLRDHAAPGQRLYFDEGDYYRNKGVFLFYATCFWNPNLRISRYRREVERLQPDYVISWDKLPLEMILETGSEDSRRYLYRTGGPAGVRRILDDSRYFDVARLPPESIENAWNLEENSYVWTKGLTRFHFRYRLPRGGWVLALSGGGPRPRNNYARLRIYLDGVLLHRAGPLRRPLSDPRRTPRAPAHAYSHIKGPGNAVWRFPVPPGAAKPGMEHTLTIQTNTFVPARELTDNPDNRELGIQVFWFKIEEPTTAESQPTRPAG